MHLPVTPRLPNAHFATVLLLVTSSLIALTFVNPSGATGVMPGPNRLLETTIKRWPNVTLAVVPRTPLTGAVTVLTGGDGVKRVYDVQRSRDVRPRQWKTIREGHTNRGLAAYNLMTPRQGSWLFRIRVPKTTTAKAEKTPSIGVHATPNGMLNDPRAIQFLDEQTLRYLTGPLNRQTIHVRHLATGVEEQYDTAVPGVAPNGDSGVPVLSPNKRFVAFWSDATNLVSSDDANFSSDLFVKDMRAGTVTKVMTGPWGTLPGGSGNYVHRGVAFSPDSSRLTFSSDREVYVYDIESQQAKSVVIANCSTGFPVFSADGTRVYLSMSHWAGAPDNYTHFASVDLDSLAVTLLDLNPDGMSRFPGAHVFFAGLLDTDHALVHEWGKLDRMWTVNLSTGAFTLALAGQSTSDNVSTNGRYLVSPAVSPRPGHERLRVTDLLTGTHSERTFPIQSGFQSEEALASNDGRFVLTGLRSNYASFIWAVRLYDMATGNSRLIKYARSGAVSVGGQIAVVVDGQIVIR